MACCASRKDSLAAIRSEGLVGDKYVEIYPGRADAPQLPNGVQIEGSVPIGFDDLTKLASDIGKDVKELTGALAGRALARPRADARRPRLGVVFRPPAPCCRFYDRLGAPSRRGAPSALRPGG